MALYVDDNGDNSDGSTWAKAYQALSTAATNAPAGSVIYISSDTVETSGAAHNTIIFANGTVAAPVIVISADKTSGEEPSTYETMHAGGGKLETTGSYDIDIQGHYDLYGLKLLSEDYLFIDNGHAALHDCRIEVDNFQIGQSGRSMHMETCYIKISSSGYMRVLSSTKTRFKNCEVVWNSTGAGLIAGSYTNNHKWIEDCDLSSLDDPILHTFNGDGNQTTVRRCALHADALATPYAGTIDHPDTWILIESCMAGTDTDPVPGLNYFGGFYGTIQHDEDEYRTPGAVNLVADTGVRYSWKMTASANAVARWAPLKTPPLTVRVTPDDTALAVYVAHDAVGAGAAGDLTDIECWLEIEKPDETDPAGARYEYVVTLPGSAGVHDPLAAATDLTNEGSDEWNATPTVYQQITHSIAPTEVGYLRVRVCFAPETVPAIAWLDPKVHKS